MAIQQPVTLQSLGIDKKELRRKWRQVRDRLGWDYDEAATAERSQQLAREQGIRPEDNILSSEIVRMRYGDEAE